MLNPYHQAIDIKAILAIQNHQYQEALYLEQSIPAASQIDAAVQVTSLGHFMLLSLTGAFTTVVDDGQGAATDDGINQIFIQLLDGSNQRPLFSDFVAANLFLSPGRIQILPGVGNASDQLYLEYPFIYTFPMNGQILCRIRNTADWENRVKIMFKGIRIFASNRGA
jgi:hypothetical protein